jgi:hypothetical protein
MERRSLEEAGEEGGFWQAVCRRLLFAMSEGGMDTSGLVVPGPAAAGDDPLRRLVREHVTTPSSGLRVRGVPGAPDALLGFAWFLESAAGRLRGRRLLLLIDDLDVLDDRVRTGRWTAATPRLLGALAGASAPMAVVTADVVPPAERDASWWGALAARASVRRIGLLAPSDAERLIRDPVRGRLEYDEEAVRRVMRLTAGHPAMTQAVCRALVARLNVRGRDWCEPEDVEAAAVELAADPPAIAAEWWAELPLIERLAAAALAAAAESSDDWVPVRAIDGRLREHRRDGGFDVRPASLRGSLGHLCDRETLEQGPERDTYRFRADLLRRWVRLERPVWEVAREVSDPDADLGGIRVVAYPALQRWGWAAAATIAGLAGLAVGAWTLGNDRTPPPEPAIVAAAPADGAGARVAAAERELERLRLELTETLQMQAETNRRMIDVLEGYRRETRPGVRDEVVPPEVVVALEEERRRGVELADRVNELATRIRDTERRLRARPEAVAAAPLPPLPPLPEKPPPLPATHLPPPPDPPVVEAIAPPIGLSTGLDPGDPLPIRDGSLYRLVDRVFETRRERIALCSDAFAATVIVDAVVDGTRGRVLDVRVETDIPRGDATGCVEEALRGLAFPDDLPDGLQNLRHIYRFR